VNTIDRSAETESSSLSSFRNDMPVTGKLHHNARDSLLMTVAPAHDDAKVDCSENVDGRPCGRHRHEGVVVAKRS
jgi:hypothetical protein